MKSPETLRSAAAQHYGLARAELDREAEIGRVHRLASDDRAESARLLFSSVRSFPRYRRDQRGARSTFRRSRQQ